MPKNKPPIENPRMRSLRTAHAQHVSTMASLKNTRSLLAFEKIDGIDLDGLTHAIHILEAVDEQVVTAYGKLALERDMPRKI